jgi:hypothetical protein
MRYNSYSLLASALDGKSGQSHAPAALYTQERIPDIHWMGDWVGLSAGLDTNEKSLASAGDRTPVVQFVVRHYSLP